MAMTRQVGFRADAKILKDLDSIADGNRSEAIHTAIASYLSLWREEMRWMKGYFTGEEIKYIVDMLNATIIDPQFAAKSELLAHEVEDADKYEGLGEKWGVDTEHLANKCRELSPGTALVLQQEIKRWWASQSGDGSDLEKFVEKLK